MRVFQNSAAARAFRPRLDALLAEGKSFADKIARFHAFAYDASHTLAPVLRGDKEAFYTHGDNVQLQRTWASEQGMPGSSTLEDILLAQIETHRADVFYNLDFAGYPASLVQRLPGCVKATIGWHAAPPTGKDISGYLMVCNFPSILASFRRDGLRAAYFAPAHDPKLDRYAQNDDRDIDILFVGGYTRFHQTRAAMLQAIAGLSAKYRVHLALSSSRIGRLADGPLGIIGPLRKYRRPKAIREVAHEPVFGVDYYALLKRARIVVNGAINLAGPDRGNMRCWEALGARSLLLSDDGNYPQGMVPGTTLATYEDADVALDTIHFYLANERDRLQLADAGYAMIRTAYSKDRQWEAFQHLVATHF